MEKEYTSALPRCWIIVEYPMVLHKFFSVAQTNETDNGTFVYKFYMRFTIISHILIAHLSHNGIIHRIMAPWQIVKGFKCISLKSGLKADIGSPWSWMKRFDSVWLLYWFLGYSTGAASSWSQGSEPSSSARVQPTCLCLHPSVSKDVPVLDSVTSFTEARMNNICCNIHLSYRRLPGLPGIIFPIHNQGWALPVTLLS